MKITKAVIPCGGMGTRFLPITKAVPKEILPVIDTPVLAHIVNEAVNSGITDIMIVLPHGKAAIKEYFAPNAKLEDALSKAGKTEFLQIVKNTYSNANIVFGLQEKPLGSADAVAKAKPFTGEEPFCLAWGDDLICAEKPVMGQLSKAYEKCGTGIIGVQTWAGDDIVRYGVADVDKTPTFDGRLYNCRGIVEKPPIDKLPSRLAALGRYVLTRDVYAYIEKTTPGKGGELQLTDTLNMMCEDGKMYVYDFEGKRYDMGDKFGAVQATVEYALKGPFKDEMREYIKRLAKTL